MDTQMIVALIIAIPVILIPLALVWHLNVAGIRNIFHAANHRHNTH